MVRLGAKFRGHEEFARKLNRMIDAEEVKRRVHKNGIKAQKWAKMYAPVDTGNLKRMIRDYVEDGGYTNRVTSEAEYAIHQELGTRYQSGTPHIKPSFDRTKMQFISDMRGILRGE